MTYATRLRAAREREGLTQQQVAYRVGVCYSTVSAWEREAQLPVGPHAEAVAKLLGVKPPVREAEPDEPIEVDASYEPNLPAHPTDKRVVEEAARCCIAVAKSKGSYHGTTADDLVTARRGGCVEVEKAHDEGAEPGAGAGGAGVQLSVEDVGRGRMRDAGRGEASLEHLRAMIENRLWGAEYELGEAEMEASCLEQRVEAYREMLEYLDASQESHSVRDSSGSGVLS